MILLIGLCYAELGPMFPISGGVVRYPHLVWGSFASYSLGFITWISHGRGAGDRGRGRAHLRDEVRAVHGGVDGERHRGARADPARACSSPSILLAVFVAVNSYGVRLFAQINNVLVWWKLLVIVLVVAVFLVMRPRRRRRWAARRTSRATASRPAACRGIFVAISTAGIVFSYLGFRQGIELAGETKNPKRNIPLAVIGSVADHRASSTCCCRSRSRWAVPGIALAKSGSWAEAVVHERLRPARRDRDASPGSPGSPCCSTSTRSSPRPTPASSTPTIASRVSYAMGRNGNAPRWLARPDNQRRAAGWSLVSTFVVGLVLLLPFPSWQQLVGFITSGDGASRSAPARWWSRRCAASCPTGSGRSGCRAAT